MAPPRTSRPHGLNSEQKRAVLADHKPLLIVAGAGTGKTLTLTSRIIHFIESGVPPEQICALTFTNKAAKEMSGRLRARRFEGGSPAASPFLGTFHALGAKILRAECRFLGREKNFVIFDDQDASRLVKKISKAGLEKNPEASPSFFRNRISAIKNGKLGRAELALSGMKRDRAAARVLDAYESELERQNAFDFDDLIEKVVRLFKTEPAILARWRRRYTHFLVDEYQDLNGMQYELVKLLASPDGRLSVVGDDQQLIYGWRYANIDTFLNFERDWAGARVVLLEENYRSSGTIIRAASEVAKNNLKQKPKRLWTRNPDGSPVEVYESPDEDDEARFIAGRIENLGKAFGGESVAVLYRTNAQSRALEQALIERALAYRIYGGVRFYERLEVKDVLAAVRIASNPKDELARERIEKTLGRKAALALFERLAGAGKLPPGALVHLFIKTTGYFARLEREFANADERKENIAELARFASGFSDLPSFLEQVSLLQATDPAGGENGPAVELMTIHLAKGLEFDRVFVAGCSEGLLPHARSLSGGDELEEERRLMYVAMTRARRDLHLSFHDIPSRFLFEIPPELTAFKSGASSETALADNEERYIALD